MPNACLSRFGGAVAVALALSQPFEARSDDSLGQYSVRGAGLINCSLFVQARAAQDDAYLVTAAWIDGYVTGINQYAEDTYDLLSFESTELLMAVIDQHCKEHPTDPLFGVLGSLFEDLQQDRLTGSSEKITIAVGEREARHYVELIERVQRKLKDAGHYAGSIDGDYSAATIEAMRAYQASVDFEATGFPDQATLWRLLRSE